MSRTERNMLAAVAAYNRVARRRGTRELTADDVAHIKARVQLRLLSDTGPHMIKTWHD